MMLRITAPHFVAGIVWGGAVAPIIRYMKGWTIAKIEAYCAGKGWKVERLPDTTRPIPEFIDKCPRCLSLRGYCSCEIAWND